MTTHRRFEHLVLFKSKKSPYLQCRFTVDGKPRKQHSTGETRIEAAWDKAIKRYQDAKLRAQGLEPEPTLGALALDWVKNHRLLLSPSHVEAMERLAKLHLYGLGERMISEITPRDIEEARLEYLQTHSKASANHWLALLSALYGWALGMGMIRFRPWKVKKLKVQQKRKPLLPTEKAAAWMEAVDILSSQEPGIGLAVRIMIGFGLRCESEALSAQWQWLDTERGTYTPCYTKGKESWARPVPDWILEILKPIAKTTGFIAPARDGKLLSPGRVQRVMDKACEAVGIQRLTPHCLRHTYATLLAESGVPIQDIQHALGHKDIRTTLRYLGIDMKRVATGQKRMAEQLQIGWRKTGGASTTKPDGDEP